MQNMQSIFADINGLRTVFRISAASINLFSINLNYIIILRIFIIIIIHLIEKIK